MSKSFEEITRPDNGPLVELNNNMQEVFSQYRKNGKSVEPIITQQALPVVPEFVAVAIEKDKQANISISDVFEATFSYENHHLTEAGLWTKNNPEKYIIARNIGYTVEKPQLFYLKNKMTGLNLVLEQSFNATGKHVGERFREFDMQYISTDEQEARLYKNTFSKAEINNMDAGSYEQIKVEGGE